MSTFRLYLLNLFHLSSNYCFSTLLTLDEGERLNSASPGNHYHVSSWTWLSVMFAIKAVYFLYVSIYDPAKVWIYKSSMWGYICKLPTCKSVFCIFVIVVTNVSRNLPGNQWQLLVLSIQEGTNSVNRCMDGTNELRDASKSVGIFWCDSCISNFEFSFLKFTL